MAGESQAAAQLSGDAPVKHVGRRHATIGKAHDEGPVRVDDRVLAGDPAQRRKSVGDHHGLGHVDQPSHEAAAAIVAGGEDIDRDGGQPHGGELAAVNMLAGIAHAARTVQQDDDGHAARRPAARA